MSRRVRAPDAGAARGSLADLDRLVETERRLENLVTEAKAEARRIIEVAQTAARGGEQAFERECRDALARTRADIETARDREIAAIETDAKRLARAFDAIDEGRIAELADDVVDRLIGTPTDGSNP